MATLATKLEFLVSKEKNVSRIGDRISHNFEPCDCLNHNIIAFRLLRPILEGYVYPSLNYTHGSFPLCGVGHFPVSL